MQVRVHYDDVRAPSGDDPGVALLGWEPQEG
jgi:hypothetical protein